MKVDFRIGFFIKRYAQIKKFKVNSSYETIAQDPNLVSILFQD